MTINKLESSTQERTHKMKSYPMKINDSSGKCATKKIKAHVELCTDRRVSITCQQLNKRKSKLLTEKETWHSLGDDTEKVILVRPDVSLGSGICYATGHHCCRVHNTEEVYWENV